MTSIPGSLGDADNTASVAHEVGSQWTIVDGYHFGSEYQRRLRSNGTRVLVLDDNHDSDYYYADIILNHNLHADEIDYSRRSSHTRLMLGCQYALLRREFIAPETPRAIPDIARNILVTLGGSDPDNVTDLVLSALKSATSLPYEAAVIVGGSSVHLDRLIENARSIGPNVTIYHNITNMQQVMAWADIGIIAGGSTYMEAAFLGMPSVIITIADNQEMIASRLAREGLAVGAGWFNSISEQSLAAKILALAEDRNQRADMANRLRLLVDGSGPKRVVNALLEQ